MDNIKYFVADLYSFNSILDTSRIQSAGQFFILSNITRSLTQLDVNGNIIGNLVKSWTVRDDFKEFEFHISENALFSDGSKITAHEVVKTIHRQMLLNTAIHFDFNAIKSIEEINTKSFVVKLYKSNLNFIRQVALPEFGVLHTSDLSKISEEYEFRVTSGAYTLEKKGENFFTLKINEKFEFYNPKSPALVKVNFSESMEKVKGLVDGSIDLSISLLPVPNENYLELKKREAISFTKPHLGYSFWISINPNSDSCKDIQVRKMLQKILNYKNYNFNNLQPFWGPAKQLYLPDGIGRLTDNETDNFWNKVEDVRIEGLEKRNFSFLMAADFPFKEEIKSILNKYNLIVKLIEYKTIGEFHDLKRKNKIDLYQIRNDFSSVDLNNSLQTTFNLSNSLIETTNIENNYISELNEVLSTQVEVIKHKIYKGIAEDILEKAFIIPIAYCHVLYFHQKNVDLSDWSLNIPEVSFWKIKLNNNYKTNNY